VRRALLLTALLALATPAASDAATRYDVSGGGWGHGVGMSQYGAYGMAQQGRTYGEILSHYYQGTRLSEAAGRQVRVLLQWSDPFVRIRGATRLSAADRETRRLRPSAIYVVRQSAGGVLSVRASGGRSLGGFGAPVRFSRPGQPIRLLGRAINGVGSGLYRGTLELHPGGGVTAVNVLELDPYVQGVVPGEMPSAWNIEALKAQAVAARSYALATRKSTGAFDQYPDTRSQVYRGVTGETASTNSAVQSTLGQILTHGGQPATTYFFSSSGGHTENVENVFKASSPRAYLRGVPDPFDRISPRHRWTVRFTPPQLDRRLGRYSPGRFQKIDVLRRGVSPRIVQARVEGSGGARLIDGPAIRSRLGLYDSWAIFRRVSTSQVGRPPRLLRVLGFRLRRRISGAFEPAPRKRRLLLERRSGRRWKLVRRLRTTRRGAYSVMVRRPGVYRVRARSVAGPAVRVR
jgi:stage II sporulation protein D